MQTPTDERVLVLMPTARDGERTARVLAGAGVACLVCADMPSLCREIALGAGAVLLTEEAVDGDRQGLLREVLAAQPPWSDLPLVVLARQGAPDAPIRESMNATLVERPVKVRSLLSVVRAALRSRRRQLEVRDHVRERRAAEEGQAFLVNLSDAIRPLSDPEEIQAVACRVLGRHLRANRAAYFEIRGDDYVVDRDYVDGVDSHIGRHGVASFGAPLLAQFLAGRTVVERDATTLPGRPPVERAAFAALAICGHVEVPLVKAGRFVAGMTVHFRSPHDWTPHEVALIEQTAERTWAAVERARAEREVRAGEERFRTLFESMDEGYCVLEPVFDASDRAVDYRYLLSNPALEKHTGLRDIVGRTAREVLPRMNPGRIEMYARVSRDGVRIRRTDHVPDLGRWFDIAAFPVGGGQVGVLFSDVTARRKAEEELRERDERLQLAVATARMGTFEIDLATDAVTVNATGRDIYGWDAARTTFARVQTHFHPDDRDEVMRRVAAAFDPGGPGVFEVEQRIIRTDGQVRWIRVRGRALFEGEGPARRAALCIGAYLDVTDQKEAEERLRDADRKKDDFIALLAHELRNPLAPIRNGLNVMKLAAEDRALLGQTRAIMERQLTHMVRLIDDLLDVSRINRNKMELRLSRVTLADAVDAAVETARPAVEARGHELAVSLPGEPIHLEADLTRLAQVFGNLLSNSAKYTRPGGRIRLEAERRGGEVAVSVRDDGIGIPSASLANIFDMFSQVDRSVERDAGGLGIGLALVKGLVEMHGGTVAAESPGEGLGSTFTVTLPTVEGPPRAPHAPGAKGRRAAGRRILVVDDSRDGADTLARMLRLMGNDVRTAHDGLEGVEAARAFRPEVVLMDIGMPQLNGLDATRRIRGQDWGRGMTIIALTGWGQDGDKERSREAGCDGHLVKPVDIDDLEKLLGEVRADEGGPIAAPTGARPHGRRQ